MQHFKFVNWWIGEFVVSFFDVTNRLLVLVRLDSRLLDFIFIKYLTIMARTALKNLILKCDAPFFYTRLRQKKVSILSCSSFWSMYKKFLISPQNFFKMRSFCIEINICFHGKYIWFRLPFLFCRVPIKFSKFFDILRMR